MNLDDVLGALDARIGVSGNGEVRYCDCDELVVGGMRVPCPPGHDCEYVRQRTALVEEAERIADALAGDDPHAWMRRFVAAMDELARPLFQRRRSKLGRVSEVRDGFWNARKERIRKFRNSVPVKVFACNDHISVARENGKNRSAPADCSALYRCCCCCCCC